MLARNKMFDWGWLPSETFRVPVIAVGNLSTGGTGKTPHVEYLADLLSKDYKVAVLSRGYKRKTKGYLKAKKNSTVDDVGDEPFQFYQKYIDNENVIITVDEKRRHGIKTILKQNPETDVLILDDAFQHRYVKPALNILLTDYRSIFTMDYVVPTGNLREFRCGANRADIIIVTKTPKVLSPIDKDLILKELEKYRDKNIFFSYIEYGKLHPVTNACKAKHPKKIKTVILLTGIANPSPLEEYIKRISDELYLLKYPDHHKYTKQDAKEIGSLFNEIFSGDKAIVTTEKDLMRLRDPELMQILEDVPVYYLPIKIGFHENGEDKINKIVTGLLNK